MKKLFLLFLISFCAISCREEDIKPIEKYYGEDYVVANMPDRWAQSRWIWLTIKNTDTVITIYIHPFDAKNLKVGDTLK